jgi:hypothetical protein
MPRRHVLPVGSFIAYAEHYLKARAVAASGTSLAVSSRLGFWQAASIKKALNTIRRVMALSF